MAKIIKTILKIVLYFCILFILGIIVMGFILNSPENTKLYNKCMENCVAQGNSAQVCDLSACS